MSVWLHGEATQPHGFLCVAKTPTLYNGCSRRSHTPSPHQHAQAGRMARKRTDVGEEPAAGSLGGCSLKNGAG